jgi:hypothetical protein
VSLTYVYCLVRSARRPSLRGIPAGMPGGGAVRILEIPKSRSQPGKSRSQPGRRSGPHKRTAQPAPASRVAERPDLGEGGRDWLIVSTVPGDAYGEEALEAGLQQLEWVAPRALAHEAVVEHFLAAPAVLPMQLFTMFTGDARAIEHVIGDKRRITAIMKRIEGQVEWGLRLTLDPEASASATSGRFATRPAALAGRSAERTAPARPRRSSKASDTSLPRRGSPKASEGGGAAYLAHKRDQRDLARTRVKKGRSAANRMYRAVSREATAARRRTETEQAAPGSRLVLDAAFLVPARRAAGFRAAVGRKARALEDAGLTVSLTGPWPAYNFI